MARGMSAWDREDKAATFKHLWDAISKAINEMRDKNMAGDCWLGMDTAYHMTVAAMAVLEGLDEAQVYAVKEELLNND